MVAIITGDIINSAIQPNSSWMEPLKAFFNEHGPTPGTWEIYRGDEFQLKVHPVEALKVAFQCKAIIRSNPELDVRIGIGIGEESHRAERISESNGTAYQRSGRTFGLLKKRKSTLMLSTGKSEFDETWNLILALGLNFMDHWSPVSAEITALSLAHPNRSQIAFARQLDIKQSAISQRRKRARWKLVKSILTHFEKQILNLIE